MARIKAAGDNAGADSGLTGLLLAEAPLKGVPALEKKRAASKKIEDSKLDIDFGSQIRSYVLHPYRMVKDHRTKYEVGDPDRVLDGDLQGFIRAYLLMRRAESKGGDGTVAV